MNTSQWMLVGLLLLSMASMSCLCLSTNRTRQTLRKSGLPTPSPRLLKAIGWLALVLVPGASITTWSWGIGLVVFFGCLSFGALLALFMASFRVRSLLFMALPSAIGGLAITLAAAIA